MKPKGTTTRARAYWVRLWRFAREWNELLSIPIGIGLFLLSPALIRGWDETSGAYDPSVLQAVAFGLAAFCVLKGGAWLLLRLDFPRVYRWLDDLMENETFQQATPLKQKLCVTFALFFCYLLCVVALSLALL